MAHLALGVEVLKVDHHRHSRLTGAAGDHPHAIFALGGGVDDDVAEGFGQGGEVALGVDHHLLHRVGALLEQAAQQMRLARAGIALHQQAGGQQFLERHHGGGAGSGGAENNIHVWRALIKAGRG